MAAMKDLKGWEGEYHRWSWMIKGKRLKVTCETLGLPPDQWTQEGSRKAAFEYKQKLTGQIAATNEARHPHAEHLQKLTERFQIATELGIDTAEIASEIQDTKSKDVEQTAHLDLATTVKIKAAENLLGIKLDGVDATALNALFGTDALWADRQKRSGRVEIGKTIGEAAKKFISGKQAESRDGTRSADGADNIRRWLEKFVAFAGALTAIDQIDFDLWERWQRACKAKSLKLETEEGAKDYGTAKAFVKWLWKQDLLMPPKNFDDRMGFNRWEGEIQTYSNVDIKKTVALAKGQLKLHLLLMLNCGMTQKDISDLLKSQIDLKAGVISRKRSKTKNKANTPLVSYQLWPSTQAELTKHLSQHPGLRALATKSGQAWCRKETTESGKIKKADNIATLWSNFKKANPDAKFLKTLKALKKSSSSLLRNSKFAEFHEFFLGHSEKSIAGRSYSKLDQNDFKAAIAWLGEQYGVAKLVKAKIASPVTPSP